MKKSLGYALLLLLVTPVISMAQSALDGTWKFQMDKSQFSKKPDVYLLQDGVYHCKTCVPVIDVKADGTDQKVTNHPYYDTVSVKVVDDRTVEQTQKKDGKTVATSKTVVSSDGKTATFEFTDSTASTEPVTGKGESTRVAKGPTGSHAISGSWRTTKVEGLSDNALTVTFKTDADTLNMTAPTGQSYSAKLDGSDSPFKGDPGTTSVSVKRLGKNSFEETDKRDGKPITVQRMTISSDGKTMNMVVNDKLHGTTSQFVATKQ